MLRTHFVQPTKNRFGVQLLNPTLQHFSKDEKENPAITLINAIKKLYKHWNLNYCKNETLKNVGLQNEPYFKYFNYADFVTPHFGLIQIKKYAELNAAHDLTEQFIEITRLTKGIKEEIYRLLVKEFRYFE